MRISNYTPERFNGLYSFHDALSKFDCHKNDIWLLGSIICKFGLQDIVGVSFLHKHFKIDANERVVRRYRDGQGNISPEASSIELVGCLWAFSEGGTTCRPVEFSDRSNVPRGLSQGKIIEEAPEFLEEFANGVSSLQAENLFGFASLHGVQYLDPQEGEGVLELSVAERLLKLEKRSVEYIDSSESAQTLWKFTSTQASGTIACPVAVPDTNVGVHCYSHCGHCFKVHG